MTIKRSWMVKRSWTNPASYSRRPSWQYTEGKGLHPQDDLELSGCVQWDACAQALARKRSPATSQLPRRRPLLGGQLGFLSVLPVRVQLRPQHQFTWLLVHPQSSRSVYFLSMSMD